MAIRQRNGALEYLIINQFAANEICGLLGADDSVHLRSGCGQAGGNCEVAGDRR